MYEIFLPSEIPCRIITKANLAPCHQWELHTSGCVSLQSMAVSACILLALWYCNVGLLEGLKQLGVYVKTKSAELGHSLTEESIDV